MSSESNSCDQEPARPEIRPYKTFMDWYLRIPKMMSIERTLARRTGFTPLTYLWIKTSGTEPRPPLLLETVGRRTGKIRGSVLPYWEVGGEYVVLGTTGGGPKDPKWVANLRAQPKCAAWIKRRRVPLVARIADAEESAGLSEAGVWHTYLDNYRYNARRYGGREIPFIVLTPVRESD